MKMKKQEFGVATSCYVARFSRYALQLTRNSPPFNIYLTLLFYAMNIATKESSEGRSRRGII